MKEDFLHFIWKNQLFEKKSLKTVQGENLHIIHTGFHNSDSGPDFLNAKIKIGNIIWVGNVEIHSQSSDWYLHGHEKNPAYDNIILHVVCQDNIPVYNSANHQIPTLSINKYIDLEILKKFNSLLKSKSILHCQNKLKIIDAFTITHFKQQLFFERLEQKNKRIQKMLDQTKNDWETVLYIKLLKYFGGTVNKEAFEQLAFFLPYHIFKKYISDTFKMEALLFGVGGLLNDEKNQDKRYSALRKEYIFLKNKHKLSELKSHIIRFHRLRPNGFPTIRIAQFVMLYHNNQSLFNSLMEIKNPNEAYDLLQITAGKYWDNHYNFNKQTKTRKKIISKNFIDRILINVVVPLKFAYAKYKGVENSEHIIEFIEKIKPEKNHIVNLFKKVNFNIKNAMDTQAIIHLYQNYCLQEKCLHCNLGRKIIINKNKN